MNATPNNALQRTRARPAGGRSPLSFETFGGRRGFLALTTAVAILAALARPCSGADTPAHPVLTVRVADNRCASLPGAEVTLRFVPQREGEKPIKILTDAKGEARFALEHPGSLELDVTLDPFAIPVRVGPMSVKRDFLLTVGMSFAPDVSVVE